MNGTELIFALLAVASFAAFAVFSEQTLLEKVKAAESLFASKAEATECAALANQYYANAGGTLQKNIDCAISGGFAFSGISKSRVMPAALQSASMLIEVERHYG
ncbi:MAG TPA: hypothetical protein VJH23_00530 [archaeon]|nr:hypothetical protein [archaeon]